MELLLIKITKIEERLFFFRLLFLYNLIWISATIGWIFLNFSADEIYANESENFRRKTMAGE
jgi:hypothetical protein